MCPVLFGGTHCRLWIGAIHRSFYTKRVRDPMLAGLKTLRIRAQKEQTVWQKATRTRLNRWQVS